MNRVGEEAQLPHSPGACGLRASRSGRVRPGRYESGRAGFRHIDGACPTGKSRSKSPVFSAWTGRRCCPARPAWPQPVPSIAARKRSIVFRKRSRQKPVPVVAAVSRRSDLEADDGGDLARLSRIHDAAAQVEFHATPRPGPSATAGPPAVAECRPLSRSPFILRRLRPADSRKAKQ